MISFDSTVIFLYIYIEKRVATSSFALSAFLNPLNFWKPFQQPEQVRHNNIFVLQR